VKRGRKGKEKGRRGWGEREREEKAKVREGRSGGGVGVEGKEG